MNQPATNSSEGSGAAAFLTEAFKLLKRREILVPALLLLVLLTLSNIVVLQNMPAKGSLPPLPFIVAALIRILGVIALAVAILRTLAPTERPRWRPDGGMFLYALTFAFGVGAQALASSMVGDRTRFGDLLLTNLLVTVLLSPLVVWFVAIAVARPLAWRPGPWLREFRAWLAPLLLWTLLIVTPMALLHATIDLRLISGVGALFWPLALFDGALSTAMAIIGLALNAAAYRRASKG
jgi:hypothetical protein